MWFPVGQISDRIKFSVESNFRQGHVTGWKQFPVGLISGHVIYGWITVPVNWNFGMGRISGWIEFPVGSSFRLEHVSGRAEFTVVDFRLSKIRPDDWSIDLSFRWVRSPVE